MFSPNFLTSEFRSGVYIPLYFHFFLIDSSEIKSRKCHPFFSYHLLFPTSVHGLWGTRMQAYEESPALVLVAGEGRALCLGCHRARASLDKEVVSYVKGISGNQNDF